VISVEFVFCATSSSTELYQIADAIAMHAVKGQCHTQPSLTMLYICPFLEEYWTARLLKLNLRALRRAWLGLDQAHLRIRQPWSITICLFEIIPDSTASTPARWVARPRPASTWYGWCRARYLCSVLVGGVIVGRQCRVVGLDRWRRAVRAVLGHRSLTLRGAVSRERFYC
jgi:hypothetical protein